MAFACFRCNSHKGPNLSGVDPSTGQLERLFHPRHATTNGRSIFDGGEPFSSAPHRWAAPPSPFSISTGPMPSYCARLCWWRVLSFEAAQFILRTASLVNSGGEFKAAPSPPSPRHRESPHGTRPVHQHHGR
ncbi:MAG: hypothetical protein ACOYMN_02540 [Roseimicrobium sp.]